jgi:pimeloyl-ACP methyl ester carboxylesterase
MRMGRTTRRAGIVAALIVISVVLSGCSSWFLPPTSTSAPTDESVAADLAPYYHQVLVWTSCGNNLQCTDAKAPLNWSKPSDGSIKLALIRQPATDGHPLGSLLVNPGGPGASGFDFIRDSIDYATDAKLQASYDIVGFDPRGVNDSTAVHCYKDPKTLDNYIYSIPAGTMGSDKWVSELEQESKQFGQDCAKYTGALLGHIGTVDAAKDLDLLRAALGDKKLNYFGYSYGTLLGQTYANMYPKNTGRIVLDGVVDPTLTPYELDSQQAEGFEQDLRQFLEKCPQLKGCPFGTNVNKSMTQIESLLNSLAKSPIRNKDGRELGSETMSIAIIYPLYNVASWPELVTLFNSVFSGDASVAFQLADGYYGRNSNGTYQDNSTEAFDAINCLDYPSDTKLTDMRAEAAEIDKLAPVFGPEMAYGATTCYDWPYAPTRTAAPLPADGSGPILVVGTTGDPATPYEWAEHVASILQNGHLVTYHGEGHTAYNKSNACVNNAVDNYFVHGTVPSTDPQC